MIPLPLLYHFQAMLQWPLDCCSVAYSLFLDLELSFLHTVPNDFVFDCQRFSFQNGEKAYNCSGGKIIEELGAKTA